MKTATTILFTALVIFQLLFYGLINAKTYWGHDIYGNMLCSIEIYGCRFNYTQHVNDYTIYKGV